MEQKNEKSGFSRNKVLQVIASILVAVAIWVYVDVEKAPERTKTIRDIPVEFSGESTTLADKNLMLLSGYDTTVDLTIKGTKRELVKINKDNVRLVASTSSIDSVGVHTLRWDVVYPDGVQSSALSVDWASKYKVTVTVGELYTKEVPVNCVVTGTVADGYFTGETVLDPTTLVLRGQPSRRWTSATPPAQSSRQRAYSCTTTTTTLWTTAISAPMPA